MRKTALSFILLFLTAFALRALTPEEIIGAWECKQVPVPMEEEDMTLKVQNKFVFKDDSSVDLKSSGAMTVNLGEHMFADLFIVVTGQGQFAVAGDSITITMDKSTVKVNMSEDDVRVRGVEDPDMAAAMQSQIFQYLSPSLTAMKENMNDMVLNDVVVGPKKMTCTDEGVEYTYNRRKK